MPPTDAERWALQATLDLCEMGVRLMRQNLRRRQPLLAEADIDRLLIEWLRHRPGAEHGDAPGRSVDPAVRLA